MDLIALSKQVENAAITTGKFIQGEIQKLTSNQMETKSLNSLVSYVDKTAEEQLVAALGQLVPEAGFVAEEGTSTKKGERYNWIIDPLDGTTNFIHGLPMYSVSIALQQDNNIVIGVVYLPELNECFTAVQGQGTRLNEKLIHVSQAPTLADSLIATGFPYYDYERMDAYTEVLKALMQQTRGIRRMGSAAIDLAYVACGRFDSFYEYNLNAWDVAAGSLLVTEAGGLVNDFKMNNNFIFGREILASNPHIHANMGKLLNQLFNE